MIQKLFSLYTLVGAFVGGVIGCFGAIVCIDGRIPIPPFALVPFLLIFNIPETQAGPGTLFYLVTIGGDALLGACIGAVIALVRRKPRPGRCSKCDYDLTGNESGICPECGTKI